MTSQGSAHGRFTRAIQRRNLFQAELALREMRNPSLLVLVDYLELLADARPDKFDRAAVRWHGRLELESGARGAPARYGRATTMRRGFCGDCFAASDPR